MQPKTRFPNWEMPKPTEIKRIPRDSIKQYLKYSSRASTESDPLIVKKYANDMKNGAEFPPLKVFKFGHGQIYLFDGFMRVHAYRQSRVLKQKVPVVMCEIYTGTEQDLIRLMGSVNREGTANRKLIINPPDPNNLPGLIRSRKDIEKVAMTIMNDPVLCNASLRQIGEWVGMNICSLHGLFKNHPNHITKTITKKPNRSLKPATFDLLEELRQKMIKEAAAQGISENDLLGIKDYDEMISVHLIDPLKKGTQIYRKSGESAKDACNRTPGRSTSPPECEGKCSSNSIHYREQ